MYCNRRAACGTVCFSCPVNLYISKQVPMCRNLVKEMLSRSFVEVYIVSCFSKTQAAVAFQGNVI
jgi:hypothetical protein